VALTREQILNRKVAGKTETYALGDDVVIIRGLTRNEALAVQQAPTLVEKDNLLISSGLVDPVMSPEDVAAWGESDEAGTLVAISSRIAELSGMSEGAGKSGVPRARRRS
jgi:hypothetical protein